MNLLILTTADQLSIVTVTGSADVTAHYADSQVDGQLVPSSSVSKVNAADTVVVPTPTESAKRMVKEITIVATATFTGTLVLTRGSTQYKLAQFTSVAANTTWSMTGGTAS